MGTGDREFNEGDKVLVLLPIRSPARYSGLYQFLKTDKWIILSRPPDKRKPVQHCHVNILEKY